MPVASLFFGFYSNFNKKAEERESNWLKLLLAVPKKKKLRILVHASSMGEFEQAKPLIEEIKKIYPKCEIIASFFSPSGLQNQKNYKLIDYSVYMPIDTIENAQKYAWIINPDISIFVRYDLWLNTLTELSKIGSVNYLICATKPASSLFLKSSIAKNYLKLCFDNFQTIFTVGESHTEYISQYVTSSVVETLSDTRADRILNIVNLSNADKIIPDNILEGCVTFIAGSSWQKDEEIISEAVNEINRNRFIFRVIYAPHEPTKENIIRIENMHPKVIKLSVIINEISIFDNEKVRHNLKDAHIVVDSIGKLLRLYANADLVYIGNGFGVSVHSTSEPAGYGVPIACGPNINKMPDAVALNKTGALTIIRNSNDFKIWLDKMIKDSDYRKNTGKLAEDFILSASGSSSKICEIIINHYNQKNSKD